MSMSGESNLVSRAGAGVVGGLGGGVLLGGVLWLMGDVTDLARGVGSSSAAWTLLLTLTAIGGGLFGVLFGKWISRLLVPAIGIGLVYGAFSGALVALLVQPLLTGGKVFSLTGQLPRLGAYVAFGITSAVVYALAGPRRRYWDTPGRSIYYAAVPRRRRRVADDN